MKNLLLQGYTPTEIAENIYLQISYKDIIRAAKRDEPIKDVKYVNGDLQLQFIKMSKEDALEFDREVNVVYNELETREEIKRLRNAISNKEIAIKQLENKLNK